MNEIKLTEYSHGAGCGCKIAPSVLEEILRTNMQIKGYPKLLVGYNTKDDAAAYDLSNGTSVLSTTDFFMPIVDDPFTFGKIAATNAISDIYAMGGKPLMAISILGWPIQKLDASIASLVIDGGRSACEAAGIPLAGGHSIDSPEPIFGLAVTGIADNKNLKLNSKAETNCEIFLTKPLGIGILTSAQKFKVIEHGHIEPAIEAMCTLNTIGHEIAKMDGVVAQTDVTGFGLMGHLSEICEASDVSAVINYEKVPLLPNTLEYLEMDCVPGGTTKNYNSYGHKIGNMTEKQKNILCDPQTSGGILAVVRKESINEFLEIANEFSMKLESIGYTCEKGEKLVSVI